MTLPASSEVFKLEVGLDRIKNSNSSMMKHLEQHDEAERLEKEKLQQQMLFQNKKKKSRYKSETKKNTKEGENKNTNLTVGEEPETE